MDGKNRPFHMEASGSLVPELEGAPSSLRHTHRTTKHEKENDPRASKRPAKAPNRQAHGGGR
ncbi:conserved hypothetical protein [uncultured Eubacteriales bacterium]|uniref:Uncharacterized protein n=1 Tax=uncultured Eubacteriales bacterium TaxID=172733 RepID=A0A212JQU9_9FIRM|nr:conserved hypothetical protein [uncultured Eubacteriales bacterium]